MLEMTKFLHDPFRRLQVDVELSLATRRLSLLGAPKGCKLRISTTDFALQVSFELPTGHRRYIALLQTIFWASHGVLSKPASACTIVAE